MKLGDVIRKEREKAGLSPADAAGRMGVDEGEVAALEAGDTAAEEWGPRLAAIAIALETPTSRLLADSGRAADTEAGNAGPLIRRHREARSKSLQELAEAIGVDGTQMESIEAGDSPLETWGPRLLAFAEAIEQPVFNLFYPCGLPFQELDDYP